MSRRSIRVISVAILVLMLTLTGCIQFKRTPPPPTGLVVGKVTEGRGGPGLAAVTIKVGDAVATTAADGTFTLTAVVGDYDLIAMKTGYGTVRVHNVKVEANATAQVDVVQNKCNALTSSFNAPRLTVTGLSAGQVVSGVISFQVSLSSDLSVHTTDIRFGHKQLWLVVNSYTANPATVTYNTANMPNGDALINIISYDSNLNAAELTIPVIVNNDGTGLSVPSAPSTADILGYTTGVSVGVLRMQRAEQFMKTGRRGNPDIMETREGTMIDLADAPGDSQVWARIRAPIVAGANGIKVYRKIGDSGSWKYVGSSNYPVSGTWRFYDTDPYLPFQTSIYYKVSYFNAAGEGPSFGPVRMKFLEPFHVNLLSPANGATGVALVPTFKWTTNRDIVTTLDNDNEGYAVYQIFVRDVFNPDWDEHFAWDAAFRHKDNSTPKEIQFGYDVYPPVFMTWDRRDLRRGAIYEWDIYQAYIYQKFSANAESYAYSSYVWSAPKSGSENGMFQFMTEQ